VRRRPKLVATALLLLTFFVGALGGMAAEEAFGIDWFEFLDDDADEGEPSLLSGLELSREQRDRVEAILERGEDRLEDYWGGRLPEVRELLEETYAEIRTLLTPRQRVEFDRRVSGLGGQVPEEIRE